jgi:hypothetical protein
MRIINIRSMTSLSLSCSAIALLFVSSTVSASNNCKLNYPIVLTHHWGMKKICESAPDESCDRLVPEKYCQQWSWDEQDQNCLSWRVPDDELDLPPRNYNQLADNPAFASLLVRAKALRNTVNFALAETGAKKVVIIGMSQSSQDARQLALLPVADANTVLSLG